MTCIVAITDGTRVIMGADSAGVSGLSLCNRKDRKIYKVGEMLIGFTSSFRMGQILGYKLILPPQHDLSIEEYMNTLFIDAVRDVLKLNGYSYISNNVESGGTFLVGYKNRIFKINSDFQVGESNSPYDAVGCGEDIALGSLFTTQEVLVNSKLPKVFLEIMPPRERIILALQAAEKFSAGVRAPFYCLEI